MSTRAPSLGRGCRAQRGGVGFFLRRSRLLFAFPLGEGGPRQRRSGAAVNAVLETIFPALFHTASPLSAPSGHLPLEGKALFVHIVFPHMHVFALTMREKRCSRFVAFPLGEGGPRQRCSGALVNGALETFSLALFHTASTLSAPSGHLPLEGKAFSVRILFPHMCVFALTMREKRCSRIVAFPIGVMLLS